MPQLGAGGQRAGVVSPSPMTDTTAGLMSSPSWQNQIAGYLAGGAEAGIAQSGLSAALGSQSLALSGPGLAVSSAELENSTGFDLANAALGEQGINISQGALAEQAATAAAQQGTEEQQYGVQMGQYPEQQAEAALANKNTLQQMSSQGAGTGTLGTVGHGTAEQTQSSEYGWQQADIFRNQQLAQLAQQSEEQGYAGQEEQTAASQAQLGLAAQQQGLTAQQAAAQLGFGLQSLGVGAQPEQFISSIANAQGAGAQQLSALGSQASLIGGLGANFLGG